MIVCPYDCHWCDRSACRADGCEITGDPPLIPCMACGEIVIRIVGPGVCIECMSAEARIIAKEVQ